MPTWDKLIPDLRQIVWDYAGGLNNRQHRLHTFCGTELRFFKMLQETRGYRLVPSDVIDVYKCMGVRVFKNLLYRAYLRAQLPATFQGSEAPVGSPHRP